MSVEFANRGIVRDGLIFSIDAFNKKSYVSGSTTVYDLNKNGNNGTLTNGVTSDGFSLGFDGTNQWIDFLDENIAKFDFTDPFSVDFWIKKQTGSVFDWVCGRAGTDNSFRGWGILYRQSPLGAIGLGISNATTGSQSVYKYTANQYNDDTWRHHCITYNGSSHMSGITIYTNSVMETEFGITNSNPVGSAIAIGANARFVVGRRYNESGNYMESDLRTLNIYNKELTHSEVKQNYFAIKEKVYGSQ